MYPYHSKLYNEIQLANEARRFYRHSYLALRIIVAITIALIIITK